MLPHQNTPKARKAGEFIFALPKTTYIQIYSSYNLAITLYSTPSVPTSPICKISLLAYAEPHLYNTMAFPPEPANTNMDLTFNNTDLLTPTTIATDPPLQLWLTPEYNNISPTHIPQHNDNTMQNTNPDIPTV
jgi:hypothetical protein